MTTVAETLEVDEWITSVLTGDATYMASVTGVHQHPAPPDAKVPYTTVDHVPGNDTVTSGQQRVISNGLWRVILWYDRDTPFATVNAVVARQDELLNARSVTHGGITVACHRERPARAADPQDAHLVLRARGGWYRIWVHPTP